MSVCEPTRRELLATAALSPLLAALPAAAGCTAFRRRPTGQHVVVIGAGAFGGWTAWHLLAAGHRVTLVDAWGPGNSRASSGGDTRVLRHTYGDDRLLLDLAARSRQLFLFHEGLWGTPLFEPTGLLWLVHEDDAYERSALPHLAAAGIAHEVLDVDEIARRFPQVGLDGVRWALTERDAGVLLARRTCAAVWEACGAAGAARLVAAAAPGPPRSGRLDHVRLSDGRELRADAYVFAAGPWLGQLFLELHGGALVRPTRQEVFTFGTPSGDTWHRPPRLPVWADHGQRFVYGIPGNEGRGFKLADDTRGDDFDPTSDDRIPSAAGLAAAREFLARRFPALADAPLLEARVCAYENSPDGAFIVDRHPQASNLWIVGGGSGHGFKHGPALGEIAAACVTDARDVEPRFALARLAAATDGT